jgi:phage shock protein PspC (stress-responsive transcriptional regulator)
MGKEIAISVGVLLCVFGMSMSVIIGYAAALGQADVGVQIAPAVSDFLLRHWNIAMVMGPFGCTVVVYLGSWAISMGLQPSPSPATATALNLEA